MCSCIPGYNPVGPLCLSSFPVDDGADEHVAEDADHEDDGLEERAHHGVVERVVLGVFAPWVTGGADSGDFTCFCWSRLLAYKYSRNRLKSRNLSHIFQPGGFILWSSVFYRA